MSKPLETELLFPTVVRAVNLFAFSNEAEPPSESFGYKKLPDGLSFADNVFQDDLGVTLYTNSGVPDKPYTRCANADQKSIRYRRIINPTIPDSRSPYSQFKFPLLGILDVEPEVIAQEKPHAYSGDADRATVISIAVFCSARLPRRTEFTNQLFTTEELSRMNEKHTIPVDHGSLVFDSNGLLQPVCDDKHEDRSDIRIISSFRRTSNGLVILEAPTNPDLMYSLYTDLPLNRGEHHGIRQKSGHSGLINDLTVKTRKTKKSRKGKK